MKSQGGYPNGDFRIASENTSLQLDLGHASERREFNKEAVRIFPLSFDSLFLFLLNSKWKMLFIIEKIPGSAGGREKMYHQTIKKLHL